MSGTRKRSHGSLGSNTDLSIADQRQQKSDLSRRNKLKRQKLAVDLDKSYEQTSFVDTVTVNPGAGNVLNPELLETQHNISHHNIMNSRKRTQTQQ